jgi:ABC-type antimicrobial peptide transport system permease subunit
MARGLDEGVAISRLATLEEATSTAYVLPRFAAMAFGLFGGLGLVLAAIGVYSVMAYTVSRRSREVGIRMAMGARRQDILRKMLLDGLALAAMGLALGWILATIVTPFLGFMLYGVGAHDIATFASVAIFLAIIAGFAVYIPARRASAAEPADILRYE